MRLDLGGAIDENVWAYHSLTKFSSIVRCMPYTDRGIQDTREVGVHKRTVGSMSKFEMTLWPWYIQEGFEAIGGKQNRTTDIPRGRTNIAPSSTSCKKLSVQRTALDNHSHLPSPR